MCVGRLAYIVRRGSVMGSISWCVKVVVVGSMVVEESRTAQKWFGRGFAPV